MPRPPLLPPALFALTLAACREPAPPPAPIPSAPPTPPTAAAPAPADPLTAVARLVARGDLPAAQTALAAAGDIPLTAAARPGGALDAYGGTYVAWSGDQRRAGVVHAGELRVYDLAAAREITARPLPIPPGSNSFARLDPRGALALLRSGDSGSPPLTELWSVESGERLFTLPSAQDAWGGAAFSPDGRTLSFVRRSAAGHDEIVLWDTQRRAEIRAFSPAPAEGGPPPTFDAAMSRLEFSADGSTLTAGFSDKLARTWELKSGALQGTREGGWMFTGPEGLGARVSRRDSNKGLPVIHDLASGRELGPLTDPRCPAGDRLAFAPRGPLLVTQLDGDHLCLWESKARRLEQVIEIPPHEGRSIGWPLPDYLHFTPDGAALLVVIDNLHHDLVKRAHLVDAAAGRVIKTFSDITLLGAAGDGAILVYDEAHGELTRVLSADRLDRRPLQAKIGEIALPGLPAYRATIPAKGGRGLSFLDGLTGTMTPLLAEDGPWLTSAPAGGHDLLGVGALGEVRAWDLDKREPSLSHPVAPTSREIVALRVSTRGDALVIASAHGDETRFSLSPAGALQYQGTAGLEPEVAEIRYPENNVVRGVALDNDARVLALRETPTLEIAVPGLAAVIKVRPLVPAPASIQDAQLNSLVLSPDGAYAAAQWGLAEVEPVRIFRMPKDRRREPAREIKGIGESLGALTFDPASKLLAGVVIMGDLKIWQIPSMRPLATLPLKGAHQLAFSPDGAALAVATWDPERGDDLLLWEVAKKKDRCHQKLSGPITFSPDGEHFTVITNDQIVTLRTRDCERENAVPRRDLGQVVYLPDGRTLAGTSSAGQALILDAQTGQVLVTLRVGAGAAAAISPEGRVELFGEAARAKRMVACTARGFSLPYEMCEGKLGEAGLLAKVLAGRLKR